jgi:hypothetical protein
VKQFEAAEDMSCFTRPASLEVWTGDRNRSGVRQTSGNDYASSRRFGGQSLLVESTPINSVNIYDLHPGMYKFRIRYADGTYSDWLEDVLHVRKHNVFTTDVTVSSKTYKGVVYFPKIK